MAKSAADMQPKSPESLSVSASSILGHLMQVDVHSDEFSMVLNSLLRSKDFAAFVSELHGHELILFIDFLDLALDAISTDLDLQRRCLRSLRKICGTTLQLPSSHLITKGLVKKNTPAVASGGFADVYVGSYHRSTVAIKCIRIYSRDNVEALTKTFCKEVVIWKRLRHPHILPFLGVSTSISDLCMVSEWMEHGNVARYLDSHPDGNRLQLLLDTAKGLEYLHSQAVVHGDIKAHNVLIDKNHRARLADFGLSSISNDPITNASSHANPQGTARWMAPELLDPNLPDTEVVRPTKASDVYAFAMLIIEVFTGNVPFHGYRTEVAVISMLGGSRPKRPTDAVGLRLTDEVWNMVRACWKNKPQRRPIASDIVQILEKAVSLFEYPQVHIVAPSIHSEKTSATSAPASRNISPLGSASSLLPSLHESVGSSGTGSFSLFTPTSNQDQFLLSRKRSPSPHESYESYIQELNGDFQDDPLRTQGQNPPGNGTSRPRNRESEGGFTGSDHNLLHAPHQTRHKTLSPTTFGSESPLHPSNFPTESSREPGKGRLPGPAVDLRNKNYAGPPSHPQPRSLAVPTTSKSFDLLHEGGPSKRGPHSQRLQNKLEPEMSSSPYSSFSNHPHTLAPRISAQDAPSRSSQSYSLQGNSSRNQPRSTVHVLAASSTPELSKYSGKPNAPVDSRKHAQAAKSTPDLMLRHPTPPISNGTHTKITSSYPEPSSQSSGIKSKNHTTENLKQIPTSSAVRNQKSGKTVSKYHYPAVTESSQIHNTRDYIEGQDLKSPPQRVKAKRRFLSLGSWGLRGRGREASTRQPAPLSKSFREYDREESVGCLKCAVQ